MCGISGVVDLGGGPVGKGELAPVNDALRLRGPDDEGYFSDGVCALGHRRLSIIDLAGGHQPMANENDTVEVVLNGEIYNFTELRPRLEALGHKFATRSDTEVIVHGYEEWGEDVVNHLDGMFAFALWDRTRRRLLIARDRFGKKPLYWFRVPGRFAFASTLAALLKHPAAPRAIDPDQLARYLALEFVPSPGTMIAGIHKLEPGQRLLLDASDRLTLPSDGPGRVHRQRYWRLDVRSQQRIANLPSEAVEQELRERLVAATKKRLVSDVPLGIFLSGGIDSSSVVAAATHAGAHRIKTFSIGFGDKSFDETEYARIVARHFGTDHIEERLSESELLAIVPRLGEILDEPMADGSIVPTYLLSRVARQHVTVALGGDGGDELFAGYPMYQAHRVAGYAAPFLGSGLLKLVSRAAAKLPVSHKNMSFDFKLKKTLEGMNYPEDVRNYVWLGAFRPDELGELLGRSIDVEKLLAPVAAAYREAPGSTHLEKVLYQDIRLYMAEEILVKVDRASMAVSLEVRAPLLDTAFAEYVASIPIEMKLDGMSGKAIFKKAMRKWLPEKITDRPKKGFGMPIGAWLKGPLKGLARELLESLSATGLVSSSVTTRLLEEHCAGTVDHRKRLWTLMVLELWRRNVLG